MRRNGRSVAALLLAVGFVGSALAAERPMTVSPGSPKGALIGAACPTFSWGAVPGAKSYELVVYRLSEEREKENLVLRETFGGSASSWTPSLNRCLERGGRYAWSVRAMGRRKASDWSAPSLFEVASGPSAAEIEEALEVVRDYLGHWGDAGLQPATPAAAQSPVGPGIAVEGVGAAAPSITGPVADAAVLPVGDLDCRAGRYEDNEDGTVTDCRTGLIWLKAANCLGAAAGGFVTWAEAQALAAGLDYFFAAENCGLSDFSEPGFWRLPTKTEWQALVASARLQGFTSPALTDARGTSQWTDGDAFVGVASTGYWSATVGLFAGNAWVVNLVSGGVLQINKLDVGRVWVVREQP